MPISMEHEIIQAGKSQ